MTSIQQILTTNPMAEIYRELCHVGRELKQFKKYVWKLQRDNHFWWAIRNSSRTII